SNFNNITMAGQLTYRVGYNSALYSVFLRRDGTLPMTGELNMGGNNISNAKDITASGMISSGTLKSTGLTDIGGQLLVTGTSLLKGAVSTNGSLTVD
ncbi:shufflon protein, partial [Escherichia coli]|nr:shufflon protein [Escherichia coli]